jgi:putative hemolysin
MGLLVALAGCASSSSPVGTKEQQHAKAVARASEYCRKQGLVMRASGAAAPSRPGQAQPELQFRCVKAK